MKVVFRADLKIAVRNVLWYERNVLISLHSDRGDIDILGGHWKHKEDWWTSFGEALDVCISTSRQFIFIGDMNVESRTLHQSSNQAAKWVELEAAITSKNAAFHNSLLDFSRRRSREREHDSLIDHLASSNALQVSAFGTHYASPGDHAWLGGRFRSTVNRVKFKPTWWRVSDWEAYKADIEATCPQEFGTVQVGDKIQQYTQQRTRAQRRAEWEPLQIKALRDRIRASQDEQEQHDLSVSLPDLAGELKRRPKQSQRPYVQSQVPICIRSDAWT